MKRLVRRISGRGREGAGPFERRRRDPSPSRLRYRLDRLGRRGYVRFAMRRLAWPAMLGLVALWAWHQPWVWARGEAALEAARSALVERPEFLVTRLRIEGGSEGLKSRVAQRVGFEAPISSLKLDLRAIREAVQTTPGVASARVAVLGTGVLSVRVTQRAPAALWRWDGQLHLVDRDGVVIAPVARRADRPGLPLIVGEGADRAAAEALRLWARAAPLHDRLQALVRVGERRWTLALVGPQRVHLPAEGAETALSRLLALDAAEEILEREVSAVDLRDPERPVLRLTPRGANEAVRMRALRDGKGEDA
jgi:cell division protein FtsQ